MDGICEAKGLISLASHGPLIACYNRLSPLVFYLGDCPPFFGYASCSALLEKGYAPMSCISFYAGHHAPEGMSLQMLHTRLATCNTHLCYLSWTRETVRDVEHLECPGTKSRLCTLEAPFVPTARMQSFYLGNSSTKRAIRVFWTLVSHYLLFFNF